MTASQQAHVSPSEFYFRVNNSSGDEAAGRMRYITRSDEQEQAKGRKEVPARGRSGFELTEREREKFVEAAERHDYVQRWHVSPPPDAEATAEDLRRETASLAHERTKDVPTSRVAYAVHDDQSTPHAHVLITGPHDELRMDREDIAETRTKAHERLGRGRQRNRSRHRETEQEREHEQQQERGRGVSR